MTVITVTVISFTPVNIYIIKNILSVPSGGGACLLMLSFSWKEAEINQGIIRNFKSYF
jgi:hypothetical protein